MPLVSLDFSLGNRSQIVKYSKRCLSQCKRQRLHTISRSRTGFCDFLSQSVINQDHISTTEYAFWYSFIPISKVAANQYFFVLLDMPFGMQHDYSMPNISVLPFGFAMELACQTAD